MRTTSAMDYKRLAMIFIPTILIFAGSGVIALPSLNEIRSLSHENSEALATIAEAQRVSPLLARYEGSDIEAIEAVEGWLDATAPGTDDPRIFFADLRLAELQSGITLLHCDAMPNEGITDDLEEAPSSHRARGSDWSLDIDGSFQQITAFLELLLRGERLYLSRGMRLEPTDPGLLRLQLLVFVPWLAAPHDDQPGADH